MSGCGARFRAFAGRIPRATAYFSLKDEGAKIDAVIWRGSFARLRSKSQEGLEVIATGKISSFPGNSELPDHHREHRARRRRRAHGAARRAQAEARRRGAVRCGAQEADPFPAAQSSASSPRRRAPSSATSCIASTTVSRAMSSSGRCGCRAKARRPKLPPPSAASIAMEPKPDLIIVARGGGSLEDLWGFNEEIVVRAAAESAIPLISAVGHETDTTLIDFASDLRAPTPTAAAERAVPVRSELLAQMASLAARLERGKSRAMDERRTRLRRRRPRPAEARRTSGARPPAPRRRFEPAWAGAHGQHRAYTRRAWSRSPRG